MTKEEAIKQFKKSLFYNSEHEPVNMAIEALKVEPCEDCISRQAAIALAKDIYVPIKDGTVYKYKCIDPDDIKELPSKCNVIYCRDCMFYLDHRCQATRGLDDWRNQDDYCSRAERRKE